MSPKLFASRTIPSVLATGSLYALDVRFVSKPRAIYYLLGLL